MASSEIHLSLAVDRIIRIWAMVKMVPEQQLSNVRSSVEAALRDHAHMTDDELVVLGLKHLYGRSHLNEDSSRPASAPDTKMALAAAP